jgi:hypothetical protein
MMFQVSHITDGPSSYLTFGLVSPSCVTRSQARANQAHMVVQVDTTSEADPSEDEEEDEIVPSRRSRQLLVSSK